MISKSTVLILGAGASIPYKFPSGDSLLYEVVHKLRKYASGTGYPHPLNDNDKNTCRRLSESLLYSGLTSVDQFLESHLNNPDFVRWGKTAIVDCLIPKEKTHNHWMNNRREATEDDWYPYLWRQLKTVNHEDFPKNQLTIITFNYDRSLTEFLFRAIKFTYGLDDEKASEYLSCIRTIHIHGSLGEHPYASVANSNKPPVPYGGFPDRTAGHTSWDCIQIVHENNSNGVSTIDYALDSIMKAKRIAFLGFGYLEENLIKLKYLDNYLWGNKLICGSTHGMREGEIKSLFGKYREAGIHFQCRSENPTCLEFLRVSGFFVPMNLFDRTSLEVGIR